MKLSVKKADLARELQHLQAVAGRKGMAILDHALLTMSGTTLTMVATDLDVTLKATCEAVGDAGQTTVGAKKLYEIVRELPDGQVEIDAQETAVAIAAGAFKSKMPTLPVADFPAVPDVQDTNAETMPTADLKAMVERTRFAITASDTRYYLNGALLIGTVAMVATDGHRLALAQRADVDGQPSQIIPGKTLGELARLLERDDAAQEVEIRRGPQHLQFVCGNRVLTSQLIDAQFPAWDRVIPKGNDKRVTFDRVELQRALVRVGLVAKNSVKLALSVGECVVTAASPEYGDAAERLAVQYSAEDMELNVNPHYVRDFLGVIETEQVTADLKTPEAQVLFTPVGETDKSYTYVVMPMRV